MTPPPAWWPTLFVVPRPKITRYLLDTASPDGGSKAKYLMSYGFDAARPRELEEALLAHASAELLHGTVTVAVGYKLVFVGDIDCPNGKRARLRTVWQVEQGAQIARFITAVPQTR